MGMIIPAIIGGIGSVVSGIGGMNAANYQSQVAQNNAAIARQQGARDVEAADVSAMNKSFEGRANLGTIRTAQSANGIDSDTGSAVKVQQSQAEINQLNALTIRNRGQQAKYQEDVNAVSDEAMSGLYGMQGQNALTSSLISGASSIGKGWWQQNMYGNMAAAGSNTPNLTGANWGDLPGIW